MRYYTFMMPLHYTYRHISLGGIFCYAHYAIFIAMPSMA